MTTVPQLTQDGLSVPYVALWSGEYERRPTVAKRWNPDGELLLGCVSEKPYDRDTGGALWTRHTLARGRGRAHLDTLHSLRQRQCMTRLLCQICGDETDLGNPLFLLRSTTGRPVTEGQPCAAPPLHEGCAALALRQCPALRRGAVAARAGYVQIWGVAGLVYDLDTLRPESARPEKVSYLSAAIRRTLATRAVSALYDLTPVDLRDLADPAPAPP